MTRIFSKVDKLLFVVDQGLKTLFVDPGSQREYPAKKIKEEAVYEEQRKQSAALMRINHVGEVCAQGLYLGGFLVSYSPPAQSFMLQAMEEEKEHLSWTAMRLKELHDRTSYLNPVWLMGSFVIGAVAAGASDEWSYTFVEETERQVGAHLKEQLSFLPKGDLRSRAIVSQMIEDELSHAEGAKSLGAYAMPYPIQKAMKLTAKTMKGVAYYV
ncbi:MAG TPA: 2-polyprenyl-3-methyl-6-methoxy-1,4-benzoquinone monooxygenase [Gammaproteobacteria bacterium]|nr:2-polyprenyl-3-methyl-6-methoxy-1,4-benzoquinone monooxygenase [Gammaproteobacteria bacterium]